MTKKHFIELANRLVYIHDNTDMPQYDWDILLNEMIGFCNLFGKNFDRNRFVSFIEDKIETGQTANA